MFLNAIISKGCISKLLVSQLNVLKQSKQNNRGIARSTDEQVRNMVEEKWYLLAAKTLINKLLTLFSKGDTLKGLFIKE
jgi:hypothetical protein